VARGRGGETDCLPSLQRPHCDFFSVIGSVDSNLYKEGDDPLVSLVGSKVQQLNVDKGRYGLSVEQKIDHVVIISPNCIMEAHLVLGG